MIRKPTIVVTKVKKYLAPSDNLETELEDLTARMTAKDLVLLERKDVTRYGKTYVRFVFDKAPAEA